MRVFFTHDCYKMSKKKHFCVNLTKEIIIIMEGFLLIFNYKFYNDTIIYLICDNPTRMLKSYENKNSKRVNFKCFP